MLVELTSGLGSRKRRFKVAQMQPYDGNCPRNVAKDAKYAIRSRGNRLVVALTYSTSDDETWHLAQEDHPDLIDMVNSVKVALTGQPNGSFYINEFCHVIVPVVGSSDYYFAGVYRRPLIFDFEGDRISGLPRRSDGSELSPGDVWNGPRVGIPYILTAGGYDVYYQISPRPDVTKRVSLSKEIGVENARKVALLIAEVKGPSGGRFYVNEHLAIFTPLNEHGEWSYRYIGQLDLNCWFRPSEVVEQAAFSRPGTHDEAQEAGNYRPSVGFDRLSIENFKSIGDSQSFELRPINLLFGPNSAGKSSVVQAIHYLRQIIVHRDFDAIGSEIGGRFIDFDGFRNLVFQRESLDREIKIGLGFPFDVSAQTDFSELIGEHALDYKPASADVVNRTKRCDILISIGKTKDDGRPTARRLEIAFDEIPFVSLKADSQEENAYVESLNFFHPLLGTVSEISQPRYASALNAHWETLIATSGSGEHTSSTKRISLLACLLAQHEPFGEFPRRALPEITGQRGAVPALDRDLPFAMDKERLSGVHATQESANESMGSAAFISELLSVLILQPLRYAAMNLHDIRYIGPVRDVPSRTDSRAASTGKNWANGEAAWDAVRNADEALIQRVDNWIFQADKLNTKYRLKLERYLEIPVDQIHRIGESQRAIHDFPARTRSVFIDNNGKSHSPGDVGFGMSQVLPVVVAALARGETLVMVEQPELHIHPQLQANLGDLFIETVKEGKQFFLETHSENLLLRLLRRIRHTFEGAANENNSLTPAELQVLYVLPAGHELNRYSGAAIMALPISEDGEFLDEWPNGFFEERSVELFQ